MVVRKKMIFMFVALLSLPIFPLVRTGQFLHVGSMTYRYLPPATQSGDFSQQSSGMMTLNIDNYSTYLGFERLTLATHIELDWYSLQQIDHLDRTILKNDVLWQWSPQLSVGVAAQSMWADASCVADNSGDGGQYGIVARWRW